MYYNILFLIEGNKDNNNIDLRRKIEIKKMSNLMRNEMI